MSISRTVAVDGAVGFALAIALGIVFIADRNGAPGPRAAVVVNPEPAFQPEPVARPLRLAVTPKQYDDMGKLLDQLGAGFAHTDIPLEALEDVSKLTDYDVVFLTCGTSARGWMYESDLGPGGRPGVRLGIPNEQVLQRVREALRTYVGRGGTLYASDWRLVLIHRCFPEIFDRGPPVEGAAQTITADVVDDGLREHLATSKVELKFDLDGWYPAHFAADQATFYLKGEYRVKDGAEHVTAPLLAKIPFERGTIIFTSFHNEKVNSELETKLLRFLVFAAVTAKETAQAQKTMIAGGFSPQKQNLLSASPEAPSVTQSYLNTKRGRLQFALSFANQGASLELTVHGPDGKARSQEGTSSFTIDVPDAAPGTWLSTVTARRVPYPNFPFTLTVGRD